MSAGTETHLRAFHLDDTLLELNPEEEAFFKSETGIQDTDELKKHIIEVREDAFKVRYCLNRISAGSNNVFRVQIHPYFCIREFRFARLKVTKIPAYLRVLELGKSRPDAIFLDIGCCREDQLIPRVHLHDLNDTFAPG